MDAKQIDEVFVFDLDGVITDPKDSVVNPQTVQHIYNLLERGELVAINSGRSFEWINDRLLSAFGGDAAANYDRLIVICEKGGERVLWNGQAFEANPSRFALTPEQYDLTKRIFDERASELTAMFWDATKKTMATIEKVPEAELDLFMHQQQPIADRLHQALPSDSVRVDTTTIAIDIESVQAGKHAGAELIYEWAAKKLEAQQLAFVSFGDSKSDYTMAVYFARQGCRSTMVFVGSDEDILQEEPGVTVVRTKAKYAQGTLEYFAAG